VGCYGNYGRQLRPSAVVSAGVQIFLDSSGAVEELKPIVRLPGIYVDNISLNKEARRTITDVAIQWLKENSK
jgi:hypothetical protein